MLDDRYYGKLIFQISRRAKSLANLKVDDLKEVLCGIYVKELAMDWKFKAARKLSRGELIEQILEKEFQEMPDL